MAKTSAASTRAKPTAGSLPASKPGRTKDMRPEKQNDDSRVSKARFLAVMSAAADSGLLSGKTSRIGGRVSPALVKQAKRLTGIETDTDLIAFALAAVALEDDFAESFKESRGKVDRDLKLGF